MRPSIDCTVLYPGSMADVKIIRHNFGLLDDASKSYIQELIYGDTWLSKHHNDNVRVIIADKSAPESEYLAPTRTHYYSSRVLLQLAAWNLIEKYCQTVLLLRI